MATRFYKCNHCGNVIEKVVDSKVPDARGFAGIKLVRNAALPVPLWE